MTEETEGSNAGAEASSAGVDPAAVALALGGASRERADAFLKKQEALVDLQAKELAHELGLRHWSLWVRHASGLLKLALELSAGLLLLFAMTAIGVMVWYAAHADGLIIESFSVPPDLAAKGISGQVVATQMLDNLSALQAQTNSIRAPSSYANNWGDDLRVEIPETGVSIGEAYRFLRRWLGHETHISGEVVRMGTGIEITARVGTDKGETFSGSDADFHTLLKRAAASVYASTQPYRYASNLARHGKIAEEASFAEAHTHVGPPSERAWEYDILADALSSRNRINEAAKAAREAVALNPDFSLGWYRVSQYALGSEERLLAARTSLRLPTRDQSDESASGMRHSTNQFVAILLGDYDEEARQRIATYPAIDFSADPDRQSRQAQTEVGANGRTPLVVHTAMAGMKARQHDLAEARRILAEEPNYIAALKNNTVASNDVRGQLIFDAASQSFRNLELTVARETEDWPRILQLVPVMDAQQAKLAESYSANFYPPTALWPYLAYAEAKLGDFAAAHAWIDKTPGDCDLCLRTHAKIDTAQRNYSGADLWFARAVHDAPSIPFAYADWGQALLDRSDADGAIAKFTLANQKGPHFADPLEMWGEALMAKNQSHLALAKFAEADKYAPNWGRLHLKWGEALTYAGKSDEAKVQFTRAAQLDLTPTDKAELARQLPHA